MKRVINFLMCGVMVLLIQPLRAQSAEDARMTREIEVAENILSTLIKQEFSKRNFFPIEVRGNYRAGYGVTFTIPTDMILPRMWGNSGGETFILDGNAGTYSYSFTVPVDEELPVLEKEKAEKEMELAEKELELTEKEKELAEKEKKAARKDVAKTTPPAKRTEAGKGPRVTRSNQNIDSLNAVNNAKLISASKNFLADYGDMIGLKSDEKIIITNQGDNHNWYRSYNEKRSIIRIEASKGDLTSFRQGKITRDQLLARIKVTNTESTGKREPDLEVLSSAFNRLYSSDLSTTFFTQGNTYYERLTDYGAVVYMQVYSSNQANDGLFNMPTVDMREVDQEARDKKVKELYPLFESDLKENILEYGSTVKSLKSNEQLVFNVKLTKCKGCGIPSDIEVSVPYSVLKDYSMGKLEKGSALSKIIVKKGAGQ